MKAAEVFDHLTGQGCNPGSFNVEGRGGISDVYCLAQTGAKGQWEVFYSERGVRSPPLFSSSNEDEAVAYFSDKVLSETHFHCVGFFQHQQPASELSIRLTAAGIQIKRDQIPFTSSIDLRYRVFVKGQAIFSARRLLGESLPITDC